VVGVATSGTITCSAIGGGVVVGAGIVVVDDVAGGAVVVVVVDAVVVVVVRIVVDVATVVVAAMDVVVVEVVVVDVVVVVEVVDVVVGAGPPPPPDEAIVTAIDCDVGVRVVAALPAVSVTENDVARCSSEFTVPPPLVAVDVAVIVHTVADVCATEIAEMFTKSKSVPSVVEIVEQVIASSPVTVNVIDAEVAVAADRANVSVGAVLSMVTFVASALAVGPLFAAASATELAARRATTVPSDVHVTDTVTDVPEVADGVKAQPVAVPVLLKSPAAMPETDSEKLSV
jgi:hypothetical protein